MRCVKAFLSPSHSSSFPTSDVSRRNLFLDSLEAPLTESRNDREMKISRKGKKMYDDRKMTKKKDDRKFISHGRTATILDNFFVFSVE